MKPPSVYLLNTLLRKQGIQRDALRLATACSRHPLPHSIRALSDTLDELQVPNLVCKLEFEQLAEIDGAYIVAAGKTEYPFYLVEKRDRSGRKFCLRTCSGRRLEVPEEWFRSAWDGTVLLAEKGDASNEIPWFAYWFKQLLAFLDRTAVYWFAGLFVLLLGLGLLLKPLGWEDLRYPVKMRMYRFAAGDCQIVVQSAPCTVLLPARQTRRLQYGLPVGRSQTFRLDFTRRIVVGLFCHIALLGTLPCRESCCPLPVA